MYSLSVMLFSHRHWLKPVIPYFCCKDNFQSLLDIFSGLTCCINPLHSNISIHILYTVLYTFPQCWQGEVVWQSWASFIGDHFLHRCDTDIYVTLMSGVIFWGQIKCWSYLGVKGLRSIWFPFKKCDQQCKNTRGSGMEAKKLRYYPF